MTTAKIQIFHGQNGQPQNSTGCLWMSVAMVKFKGVMVMVSASPAPGLQLNYTVYGTLCPVTPLLSLA